jgi:hypothetical protein
MFSAVVVVVVVWDDCTRNIYTQDSMAFAALQSAGRGDFRVPRHGCLPAGSDATRSPFLFESGVDRTTPEMCHHQSPTAAALCFDR